MSFRFNSLLKTTAIFEHLSHMMYKKLLISDENCEEIKTVTNLLFLYVERIVRDDKCKRSIFIQTVWFKQKQAEPNLWLLYGTCFVVFSLLSTRKLNSSTVIPLNINTTHKLSGKFFNCASDRAWYLVQGIFLCIINLSPNRLHFLTDTFHLLNR